MIHRLLFLRLKFSSSRLIAASSAFCFRFLSLILSLMNFSKANFATMTAITKTPPHMTPLFAVSTADCK